MICSVCGGEVTWRGPLTALTHTQCANCGAINAQVSEHDCETEDDDCESCADTPNPTPLSPAAQAVMDAVVPHPIHEAAIAAALPLPAGEVAELVEDLRLQANHAYCEFIDKDDLRRAADLLEQRHPAPVPVSERPWERQGWCDEQGWCWFGWMAAPDHPPDSSWSLCKPSERDTATVSLPFHALPLPAKEVQPWPSKPPQSPSVASATTTASPPVAGGSITARF